MMAVHEDGVAIETRDETDDSERMVIIGTDEIQVHPGLSTTQTSGKKRLDIFIVRKRSCGKVMFLHLSVILSTGGGGLPLDRDSPRQRPSDRDPPGQRTPPPTEISRTYL